MRAILDLTKNTSTNFVVINAKLDDSLAKLASIESRINDLAGCLSMVEKELIKKMRG